MTHTDISVKWQRLCDEYATARDAHLKTFAAVSPKFAAIAKGQSKTHPTDQEMSGFEITWDLWEDAKQKIPAFVKKHG